MSDRLLSMLKQGEQQRGKATLELWRITRKHIRRKVRNGGGKEADVEDVQGKATVVLYESLDRGTLRAQSDAALVDFFKTTATYTWANIRRKDAKYADAEFDKEIASDDQTIEELLIQFEADSEIFGRLKKCLAKLDEKCMQIVSYRFREGRGLSWADIAEKMGYKDFQNAQNRGGRCMRQLRTCMGV